MRKSENVLFHMSWVWAGIGLASGLGYRELTRSTGFSGFTQLAVVHTHALVLGTVVGLLLLALQRLYRLGDDRRFAWFVWVWNVGLGLTASGLAVKGSLQVLDSAAAESPALAGVSGMGHILLTVAFVLLFVVLGRQLRRSQQDEGDRPVPAAVVSA